MPELPDPQPVMIMPHQINVPMTQESGAWVSVQVQNGGATEQAMDAMLQSLIDHLQTWPGKDPNADVTGSKYETLLVQVAPTNPVPTPDPPDPEAGNAPAQEPA